MYRISYSRFECCWYVTLEGDVVACGFPSFDDAELWVERHSDNW